MLAAVSLVCDRLVVGGWAGGLCQCLWLALLVWTLETGQYSDLSFLLVLFAGYELGDSGGDKQYLQRHLALSCVLWMLNPKIVANFLFQIFPSALGKKGFREN